MGWSDSNIITAFRSNINTANRTNSLKNVQNGLSGEYSVKNTFNFGSARPDRPRSTSDFTSEELMGYPVNGASLYCLA